MGFKVGPPTIRLVPPTSAEQRGGEVIEKLRDFHLQTKKLAKRELLAELIAHYMLAPEEQLSAYRVAKQLIEKDEELDG
jgi:hypothetical protein